MCHGRFRRPPGVRRQRLNALRAASRPPRCPPPRVVGTAAGALSASTWAGERHGPTAVRRIEWSLRPAHGGASTTRRTATPRAVTHAAPTGVDDDSPAPSAAAFRKGRSPGFGPWAGAAPRNDETPLLRGFSEWARLGSNQRPLACEASALPLSYAPSKRGRRVYDTTRSPGRARRRPRARVAFPTCRRPRTPARTRRGSTATSRRPATSSSPALPSSRGTARRRRRTRTRGRGSWRPWRSSSPASSPRW